MKPREECYLPTYRDKTQNLPKPSDVNMEHLEPLIVVYGSIKWLGRILNIKIYLHAKDSALLLTLV